jgi:putative IMPACT (imprinted ancient) family translation regulator
VRYFGGTKLGTGGLVRAYSDAVNLVIEAADLFEYKEEITQIIVCEYSDVRLVEYECEAYGVTILEKSFDAKAHYKIKAAKEAMESFLKKMERVLEEC